VVVKQNYRHVFGGRSGRSHNLVSKDKKAELRGLVEKTPKSSRHNTDNAKVKKIFFG